MPLLFQWLIAFAAGGVLFFFIGWLAARANNPRPDHRLEEELRDQARQREAELKQARDGLAEAMQGRAAAEASRAAAERMLGDQRALHEKAAQEAREAQARSLADLRDAFKALSTDALRQTQPEFLRLAGETLGKLQETAKGDLAQRQEAIRGLVEPLKQQLEAYQKRLQQSEAAQSSTLGEVKKQLELLSVQSQSLANETQQFRQVLKSNQARGRWGEETLRRVVEAAGMSAHCDFTEQSKGDEGKPDLIVRLPGERVIIVDSKVPDFDFLAALDAAEPEKRAQSLAAHAAKLRDTIKGLAARDYPRQFANALDYVVLFLPAESLFSAALEGDHDLIVWAAGRRILLATPASLIALLRSVSVSWQQHAQTENAAAIADAAQRLFERVATFSKHFQEIRDGLARANEAFNRATASYQSRVRPAGDKLVELGGGAPGKLLADVEGIDLLPPLPPA
jgi:DNA recombination protein RmuC